MRWKRGVLLLLAVAVVIAIEMNRTTTPSPEPERAMRWSADPRVPGANLPAQGRSLFDRLIGDHPVPFPFPALVERIAWQSPHPKIALVPLGRSLQRNVSAPDVFAFPRFILAADADALVPGMVLKDRLFLGYNEKAAVIEVISYNEDAARFEFQVVKDYREGGKLKVFYANRSICVSCHQNAGPIFSRPLWDETNANLRLAARLKESRHDFHGVPAESGVDTPNAIDDASDRANLFSLYVMLWREGCEDDACRGELLLDLLRYRLSGKLDAHEWARKWNARWPEGIAIPNPDLPNRDPVLDTRFEEIPASMEALNPRGPLEAWNAGNDAERALAGMSEMIPARDVAQLDRWLARQDAAVKSYQSGCEFSRRADALDFKCEGDFSLEGRALIEKDRVSKARIERLAFAQQQLRDLQLVAGGVDTLEIKRGTLRARLADGSAIEHLRLDWRENTPHADKLHGRATITTRDELPVMRNAIAPLAAQFSGKPLGRAATFFFASLGLADPENESESLPPAVVDSIAGAFAAENEAMRSFQRWCANCHRTNDHSPPNFLTGDAAAVEKKIAHCAERIHTRLAMYDIPVEHRAKTPMPPENAREGFATAELNALRDYIAAILASQRGGVPALADLLRDGYENLRECLPA